MPTNRSKASGLYDVDEDVLAFIRALAHARSRGDVVNSNLLTKYGAFNFRQRIYRWRNVVMAAIGRGPDDKSSQDAHELLRNLFGERLPGEFVDRAFLALTQFTCTEYAGQWYVTGKLREPAFGPDIAWPKDLKAPTATPMPEVDLTELLRLAKQQANRSSSLA